MAATIPDWTLWRSFAAVAEHGSLSAAARAIGASQPTLGRHVDALEAALGLRLFERSLSGFALTEQGRRALEPVRDAALRLAEAELIAAGADAGLSGTVRITASTMISHHVLPAIIADLRAAFPAIVIELVPSDSAENLLLREADIAIRMFRPTQRDLVARKLGESPMRPCAHESYLARRGTPTTMAELRTHDLLGFDRSDLLIRAAAALGHPLTRDDFAIRCDSHSALWQMAIAGAGIGFGQLRLIEATPGMAVIDLPLALPPLEVWLTTHRELVAARRTRAIYDALAPRLTAWLRGRDGTAS